MQNFNLSFSQFGGTFATLIFIATICLQILLARGIWIDAHRLRTQARLVLFPPFVWALAALVMSLVAVAFYWVCHHSNFSRRDS